MADEGNAAVLDALDTAPETPETPDPVEVETEAEASLEETETESPEGEAQDEEATEAADEPKSYSEEDLQKALKDQEARLKESARQREENAKREAEDRARKETYDRNLTQARYDRTNGFANALQSEIARVVQASIDEGKPYTLHPQTLATLAASLERATFFEEDRAHADAFNDYVEKTFPDWKPSRELVRSLEAAQHRGDPLAITEARWALMEAAVTDRLSPELRKQVEAELAERAKGESEVAKTKDAERARASQTARPTQVSGRGGGQNADEILRTASPMSPEYKRAFREKHGIDPV